MLRAPLIALSLMGSTVAAQVQAPPTSLALARDISAKLVPAGTYQKLMGGAMAKMMDGMADQMTSMPIVSFVRGSGLSAVDVAKLGKTTIRQILDIVDPAYQERFRIMMPIMMRGMGDVMTGFEPQMREGLAEAYAKHFTVTQLSDIDRFLNTSSGAAFAAQNMTIATDPAVADRMKAFMPTLMQAMPGIMEKAAAQTAGLPKAKTAATLTEADRAKLARLLGISPDELKKAPAS